MFAPKPKPKTALGYHRVLAPVAGVRVSPLCLGAMNFGENWKQYMGECTKETAFEMMDYFFENGGNFIDTSNNYQGEESEEWIGEWMASRKNREQMVIATKYTTCYPNPTGPNPPKLTANYQGQHAKSLKVSVEASLRKLQTDYIDLLYIHWWDFTTSIPEIMQSLNHLVAQGKVLYLGISDTPAWVVSKANQYARDHNLRQFSVYQGKWSAADRDFERDIIPMCRDEGMAIAPWGALGQGQFLTEADRKSKQGGRQNQATENHIKVSGALEAISKRRNNVPLTSLALAYVMHKYPWVYPIVGGRKIDHLKGNIEALRLELSKEEIEEIDNATDFKVGFPMDFLFEFGGAQKYRTDMTGSDVALLKSAANLDTVPWPAPIKPHTS
ncbi:uncharacterized protein PV09_06718 [Verruconis gallopava]|uniref:NADP-dependent oxidoreductase domain-containing protein n=1 Tax=Verruconis gallopava TaxID=253628 RepID=A0A0D2ARQ1_9PEZI|nr:uncharacterized protein PV09_06718 [Verruconis gallopava]KIW01869.1 hypothetical protein PV09_06718 [Verruconis gallopava]